MKATTVSRILYLLFAKEAAAICLCDQNPELITPESDGSFPIWSCCGRSLHLRHAFRHCPVGSYPTFSPLLRKENFPGRYVSVALVFLRNIVRSILLFKRTPCSAAVRTFLRQSLVPPQKNTEVSSKNGCSIRGCPRSQTPTLTNIAQVHKLFKPDKKKKGDFQQLLKLRSR